MDGMDWGRDTSTAVKKQGEEGAKGLSLLTQNELFLAILLRKALQTPS